MPARRDGEATTLVIVPLRPLPASERPAVLDEGARLLAFLAAGSASSDIRFEQLP